MISEGESDLVLSWQHYQVIDTAVERLFELVADLKDAYGTDRRAWWASEASIRHATRAILVEVPNINAAIYQARKLNATLFPEHPLSAYRPPSDDVPPWDVTTEPAAGQDGRSDRVHVPHRRNRKPHRPRGGR